MSHRGSSHHAQAATLWVNPHCHTSPTADHIITINDVAAAQARLERFAPLLSHLFPELIPSGGIIESELLPLPEFPGLSGTAQAQGRYWIKADHALPIAGSVKARGGVHEVLEFTERIAQEHGLLHRKDYIGLASAPARNLLSRYEVAVGSTGNLGMSIGLMSAALGFRATVHMSAEAKQWKKDHLRAHGVKVIEYAGDYARAVAAGRELAAEDPSCYFVDDEQSTSLFAGYAVAAFRLQQQLQAHGVVVDPDHPLFVYIPCGVGGAPGGIAWGLKHVYGDAVHCFFIEPEASPCFRVRLQHPDQPGITVYDVGLDNQTEADGLAVPAASELAIAEMRHRVSGMVTTPDSTLFADLHWLHEKYGLRIEPSAAAAFSGPRALLESEAGRSYLQERGAAPHMAFANHIVWTTGGSLVPDVEFSRFLNRGGNTRHS